MQQCNTSQKSISKEISFIHVLEFCRVKAFNATNTSQKSIDKEISLVHVLELSFEE
jgi:hypothetical protein